MTAGYPVEKTEHTASLVLEVADQEDLAPLLIPVTVQTVVPGGVSLTVTDPWVMPYPESFQGRDCILHLEEPGDEEVDPIKARIVWSKFNGDSQPQLSLGLLLSKPCGEAFTRLSGLITNSSKDIKHLWEKYDQVQETPANAHLMERLYIAGLVSLLGGVVLQLTGNHVYKITGWILWSVGSLGIAAKILWSIRHKREVS